MSKRKTQNDQNESALATYEGDYDSLPQADPQRRIVPVHQSRIKDRPAKVGEKDSSLKIKIELDLEVEVEIYARIKVGHCPSCHFSKLMFELCSALQHPLMMLNHAGRCYNWTDVNVLYREMSQSDCCKPSKFC